MTPTFDLEELELLAREATGGKWRRLDTGSEGCSVVSDAARFRIARLASGPLEQCQADAAYIAALSPDVVLRLIAAARLGEAWEAGFGVDIGYWPEFPEQPWSVSANDVQMNADTLPVALTALAAALSETKL